MPITTLIESNHLTVNVGQSFRNLEWADDFGSIQKAIEERAVGKNRFTNLSFDFSNCEWVDPLPVLSMLIAVNEFVKQGGNVVFLAPRISNVSSHSDKVMKFLFEEGFLELISKCCTIKYPDGEILFTRGDKFPGSLAAFGKIKFSLFYTNSSVLPAQILDTRDLFGENLDNIDKWVESNVNSIKAAITDRVPNAFSLSIVLHKLTILLGEMIQNIVKHAYKNSHKSFAGIYVRFRNGLDNNSLSVTERSKLNKALNDEQYKCPRLLREYLDVRKWCLEMFVIDAGVGFTQTLSKQLPKNSPYPFRAAYNLVFNEGKRSQTTFPGTLKGGLYHVGELLQSGEDYLCGRDEREWIGGTLPLGDTDTTHALDRKSSAISITGLAWIIRLSWKSQTESGSESWTPWEGAAKLHPVFLEFQKDRLIGKVSDYRINDFRFDISPVQNRIQTLVKAEQPTTKDDSVVFLLPGPRQTKNSIDKMLRRISEPLSISSTRTLIIADIPEHHKQLYVYSLKVRYSSKDSAHWINKFAKIVLISRRLNVSMLSKKDGGMEVIAPEERGHYFDLGDDVVFAPERFLSHAALVLRSYDSLLFWINLTLQNPGFDYFINETVEWEKIEEGLNGYLDFSQAITSPISTKILMINLERSVGFFSPSEKGSSYCTFKSIGPLTRTVVDEANGSLFEDVHVLENEVYVGSIYVTGLSTIDAQFYVELDPENKELISLYFFKHRQANYNVSHLLNWPDQKWLDRNFPSKQRRGLSFSRVGNTHVIAGDGYKSLTIPRYHPITGESVYHRRPRDSYRDWQDVRTGIMSFGHFEFDGKHDLFKINLIKVLDEDYFFDPELLTFLIGEFFTSLNGFESDQLSEKGQKYWPLIQKKIQDNLQDGRKVDFIVYPNNSNAGFVVDALREYLAPSLSNRIIALMPMNRDRIGSSFQIPPLILDSLRQMIDRGQHKKVLIFDSAVISGRTRKELKHLMFAIGASEVLTLSIMDRLRMPLQVPVSNRHKSYWRLDLPRLGSSEMCPICKPLELIDKFIKELSSTNAIARIKEWQVKWKALPYFHPVSDHGLNPTPIDYMEKKFGIRKDETTGEYEQIISQSDLELKRKNEIEIRNSLGLSLFVTELHAMTARDDLAIKYCKKYKLSAPAKIELVSSQLLLFGNEYSRSTRFDLVYELFVAANSLTEVDNWTALACIVILNQPADVLLKLFEKLKEPTKREIDINNLDLKILMAYIVRYQAQSSDVRGLNKLLKMRGDDTAFTEYGHFHWELFNDIGNIHSRPLNLFLHKKPLETNLILEAAESVDLLLDYLPRVSKGRLRLEETNEEWAYEIIGASILTLTNFKRMLDDALASRRTKQNSSMDLDSAVKLYVQQEVLAKLKNVHERLFCSIIPGQEGINILTFLRRTIASIKNEEWIAEAAEKKSVDFHDRVPAVKISETSKYIPPSFESQRRNAWIVMDRHLTSEIRFFVMNAIHACGTISDPWSVDANDQERSEMWIHVSYVSGGIELRFANASTKSSKEIIDMVNGKRKEGLRYLSEDLNVKVNFEDLKSENQSIIVILKLTLPII